ncbi:MAG: HAD-IA family hydrolase [Casimicrobiaceae bacterium]|nr:HAD-IA family hydrolase [Casimicrobiaceae bacterium]MDW8312525.1 HAD-IA family hydrolase [Burkholderiales bacterium]
MTGYELIVFDWDGTLADSTAVIRRALQAAAVDLGYPKPSDAVANYVIGLGLREALAHAVPTLRAGDVARLVERYRMHFLAAEGEIVLYEGVVEMLDRLANAGFRLAVATGKTREGLRRALERTGLVGRFEVTRCADEGFAKPHPGMLEAIFDQLGVAASSAVMVGDTTHDLQLAANAGADAVGVTYGAHDATLLRPFRSLALVDSVSQLEATLLNLSAYE